MRWPGGRSGARRAATTSVWKLEQPLAGPADELTVDELLNDLSFLRADGFVDAPTPEQQATLATPELEVELTLEPETGEGAPQAGAGDRRAREQGRDRLARADGPGLFRIPSERLTDFPREVGSYRFRELAHFDPEQAERLEIVFQPPGQAAVTITALRGDAGWSSTPEAIEAERLATLIDELSRLRANRILADAMGDAELRELGLAPPAARFTVSGKPASLAQVDLGIVRGSDGVIARASGGDAVYLLAPSVADVLPVSLDAMRSRFLARAGAGGRPDAPQRKAEPRIRQRDLQDRPRTVNAPLPASTDRCAAAPAWRWMRPLLATVSRPERGRRSAGAIADAPARLLDDQDAGGDVPGVELQLPEAVEAARGHVAEVERRAAVAAHRARALHEGAEVVEVVVGAVVHVVGEAGRDQRAAELAPRRRRAAAGRCR